MSLTAISSSSCLAVRRTSWDLSCQPTSYIIHHTSYIIHRPSSSSSSVVVVIVHRRHRRHRRHHHHRHRHHHHHQQQQQQQQHLHCFAIHQHIRQSNSQELESVTTSCKASFTTFCGPKLKLEHHKYSKFKFR